MYNTPLHIYGHCMTTSHRKFIGYFITDVHHKTFPKTVQVRFYVFEDTTSPPILLSYPASERLGIMEFKVPNEATTPAAIDTISTKKKVTFSTPLHTGKTKQPARSSSTPPKSGIKNKPFQDHSSQDHSPQNYKTIENKPFQNHSSQDHSQQHNSINHYSFQDQSLIKDVTRHFLTKRCIPHIVQNSWQHARYVLHKNRFNSTISAACWVQRSSSLQRGNRKKALRNGTTANNSTSNKTNRMDLIHNIPCKTRWLT